MDKKNLIFTCYVLCAIALILAIVSISRPSPTNQIGPEGKQGDPGQAGTDGTVGPQGVPGTTIIATKTSEVYNFTTDTNLFDSLNTTVAADTFSTGDVIRLSISGKIYHIDGEVGDLKIDFGISGSPSLFLTVDVPEDNTNMSFSLQVDLTIASSSILNRIFSSSFATTSTSFNIAFDTTVEQTFVLTASPTNLTSFDIYQVLLTKLN